MLCYNKTIGHAILEQITKLRKGFVSYFKTNGIIVFKTRVDADYGLIVKKFEKEVNNNLKFSL
jgi:hypothetical protein